MPTSILWLAGMSDLVSVLIAAMDVLYNWRRIVEDCEATPHIPELPSMVALLILILSPVYLASRCVDCIRYATGREG